MNIGTKYPRIASLTAAAVVIAFGALAAAPARADEDSNVSRTEVSLSGGVQALNKNDTALPDHFVNVPAVATVTRYLTDRLAAEGEFTWMIPVQQSVEVSPGVTRDSKSPDVLAYRF